MLLSKIWLLRSAKLDSIADDIRADKFSFDQAASVLSHDKDTRNNHGLMPNPENATSKFEMQQLPQEIGQGGRQTKRRRNIQSLHDG